MITFLFIQMAHGMEMLRLVLVFPSNTVISMRLPDSASVFTAEVWAQLFTQCFIFFNF